MERHRILVVDDQEDWLVTIESILEADYDVCTAKDAAEAIALVKETFFSLAILDQRISADQSGIALLKELREIRPGLPAIVLTGFATFDDAVDSVKHGAFDYISKGSSDLENVLLVHVARALAEESNADVRALLRNSENHLIEFKSSARWDLHQGKLNRQLEAVIVKTVAGFLNSEDGGVLLIGVDDARNPIGLLPDYRTVRPQNSDGFEAFLTKLLLESCGKDLSSCLRIDFPIVDGQEICRVSVRPAPHPVFIRVDNIEHFYLRTGNSTNQLLMTDAFAYCRVRWSTLS
jgi:ActR/RegA family two-component response regulator